jgi:hypothetical protein
MSLRFWPVIIARGPHPFPSRTRSLSLAARMVLPRRLGGRVRRRRPILQNAPIAPNSASGAFLHPASAADPAFPSSSRAVTATAVSGCHGQWAGARACGRRTHTFRCTGTGSHRSSRTFLVPDFFRGRSAPRRKAAGAERTRDPGLRASDPPPDDTGQVRNHDESRLPLPLPLPLPVNVCVIPYSCPCTCPRP